jgi:hypothetical protein
VKLPLDERNQSAEGGFVALTPFQKQSGGVRGVVRNVVILSPFDWCTVSRCFQPFPQGFPNIPGVLYDGLMSTGDLFDFGAFLDDGVITRWGPPVSTPYPAFVPKADADGNHIAGIRLPDIEVPLATYAGWNRRAANLGFPDLCDLFGMKVDFAQTQSDRLAAGDPRLSIEERYETHVSYVNKVTAAALKLRAHGLLLDEDVARYIAAAEASDVGK